MHAVDPSPWVGLPELARAAVAYIEAEAGPAPDLDGAERIERVHAIADGVDAWTAQVDRWTLAADQTRTSAATARGGEDYYTAEARRLGRE